MSLKCKCVPRTDGTVTTPRGWTEKYKPYSELTRIVLGEGEFFSSTSLIPCLPGTSLIDSFESVHLQAIVIFYLSIYVIYFVFIPNLSYVVLFEN